MYIYIYIYIYVKSYSYCVGRMFIHQQKWHNFSYWHAYVMLARCHYDGIRLAAISLNCDTRFTSKLPWQHISVLGCVCLLPDIFLWQLSDVIHNGINLYFGTSEIGSEPVISFVSSFAQCYVV